MTEICNEEVASKQIFTFIHFALLHKVVPIVIEYLLAWSRCPCLGSSEVTFRALAAQKLFADCDEKLLKRLAEEAWCGAVPWRESAFERPLPGHREEVTRHLLKQSKPLKESLLLRIPLRDEMPLMIVMSGELYVCIGGGPAATASAGFAIGFVGMMRLHAAEATPRQVETRGDETCFREKPSHKESVWYDVSHVLHLYQVGLGPHEHGHPDPGSDDFLCCH